MPPYLEPGVRYLHSHPVLLSLSDRHIFFGPANKILPKEFSVDKGLSADGGGTKAGGADRRGGLAL